MSLPVSGDVSRLQIEVGTVAILVVARVEVVVEVPVESASGCLIVPD